jgi:hypothetical protein
MRQTMELSSPDQKNGGTVKIGLATWAHISRLEGLIMSKEMVQTFESFEKSGKSHEGRRAALKRKYGDMSG